MDQKYRQNRSISHGLQDISIFVFCEKIRKFKMGAIFDKTNLFLKIGIATLQRYPVAQTFHRNCSIAHGF